MNKKLVVLGCCHLGHENCDRELLQKYLEIPNADILLIGDLIEAGVPQKANKMMEQNAVPQKQAEEAVDLLMPHKDRIIGLCTSNHSNRIWEAVGVDIDKWIARTLDVKYYGMMGQLKWNNKKISFHHGFGGGMNEWSDAQKVLSIFPDSDIVCVSHRHRLASTNFANRLGNKTHRVDFLRSGSFIKTARYAEQAAYQPTANGAGIIEILPDGRVKLDSNGII